jgi:hypothetical protein
MGYAVGFSLLVIGASLVSLSLPFWTTGLAPLLLYTGIILVVAGVVDLSQGRRARRDAVKN